MLTKEVAIELAINVFKQTNNRAFTEDMLAFIRTDEEAASLMDYIRDVNPNQKEIDKQALRIALPRLQKENA